MSQRRERNLSDLDSDFRFTLRPRSLLVARNSFVP
jgi:hypothetical protein